jgi:uncharacterized small protein (DUF1192 family)
VNAQQYFEMRSRVSELEKEIARLKAVVDRLEARLPEKRTLTVVPKAETRQ